jgi:hypothetical protein
MLCDQVIMALLPQTRSEVEQPIMAKQFRDYERVAEWVGEQSATGKAPTPFPIAKLDDQRQESHEHGSSGVRHLLAEPETSIMAIICSHRGIIYSLGRGTSGISAALRG